MVGSVNASPTQQVIANPFQQQNSKQAEDTRPKEDASRTQETRTENKSEERQEETRSASNSNSQSSQKSGSSQDRGNNIDITV